jgi:hypothetical protein
MNQTETDESVQDVIDAIFSKDGDTSDVHIDDVESYDDEELDEQDDEYMDDEEVVYEIHLDDESDEDDEEELDEQDDEDMDDEELDEQDDEDMDDEELDEQDDEYMDDEELDEQNWEESIDETYNPKKAGKKIKPKGVGIGSGPKFTYKDKAAGGFKEDKKQGPKSVGTGKAKFEYKKGANMEGKNKVVKKVETKEEARTLGMGSKFREGGLPKPRAHSKFNTAIKKESVDAEVSMLREKNEEYRKALNVFREKLNEVAIFNSNLAYATRLFTEHSTTKKEKINILRRFDGVETLKESKSLYKSIKDELSNGDTQPITESVGTKLNKQVSTGSSVNLIESKTYENPQFLRMKDLMTKIG